MDRTPLNAVLGFGQLLQLTANDEQDQECVTQILNGGSHLLQLVNEVLDITQAESGNLLLELVAPIAQRYQVTIDAGEESTISRFVRADPQRLHQVLLNLLSNAAKYNRPGGTITVNSALSGETMLRISVTDTGRGIDPVYIEDNAVNIILLERLIDGIPGLRMISAPQRR